MIYLSVIIPVRNEEKFIAETLEALINQDYPEDRVEFLVIDGMSTDKTCDEVERVMRNNPDTLIRILENPGLLSSRARNIGAKEAKGKLVAVIDAHVFIPNNMLFKNMERLKEENNARCLARPAPLTVPNVKSGMPFWIALARKSWVGHSRSSYIYRDYEGFVDPVSSGFAYDKEVFQQIGYFDESFDAAEDVEFHHRLKEAGINAYTSNSFLIYSYPRDSLSALFKQQTRYGEGRARYIRKHSSGFSLETLIPPAIFLYFIGLPVMLIILGLSSMLSIIYIALAISYIMILVVSGFHVAIQEKKPIGGIIIAAAIWITHIGLGWGFLKRLVLMAFNNR